MKNEAVFLLEQNPNEFAYRNFFLLQLSEL